MKLVVEHIERTGVEDFDQRVVHPFNQYVDAINAYNIELDIDYEAAERAGATGYLQELEQLKNNHRDFNVARSRLIEYCERVRQQAHTYAVAELEVSDVNTLFNEAFDFINKTDVYGS